MPIASDLRRYYGYTWRTKTRPLILARAGDRCERCRARVRLHVAHLDQNPANDAEENLGGLCPRCHRKHDYAVWKAKAFETRAARKDRARPLLALL